MDWELTCRIEKTDEEQRLVFGILSHVVDKDGAPIVDQQGDIIPVGELEKAAHDFMLDSRRADAMHDENEIGRFVESFVSTPEKRAAQGVGDNDPLGKSVFWWVGAKVSRETFAKVKAGELKAFSIGGSAMREAA